jgi:hypothetical protein
MVRAVSDEPEFPAGSALRADGTLEKRPQPEGSPPVTPVEPQPEKALELATRPAPRAYTAPTAYRADPQQPRRWVPVLLGGFVVAGFAIAGAAMLFTPASVPRVPEIELPTALRDALPELAGPPVVILSEPSGATVRAPTGVLGVTPWAGNNVFLTDTELTLTLPGYQPTKLVLPGAKEAHLSVTLKRTRR